MPRPGLLLRLRRRQGPEDRTTTLAWSEVLAVSLARLLSTRHGSRARPGLADAALAARDLADDAAVRRLCDELARGVTRQEPRLQRVVVTPVGRDDTGLVRLRIDAHTSAGEPAACTLRLRPLLPPEIHHAKHP